MKGFPNQVAELPTLAKAMREIVRLTDGGQPARDDGVLGEALIRAGVLGTSHSPIPIEKYLEIQRTKTRSNQSFRTRPRGLRELFRLLGFIDDSTPVVHVTREGRQVASFADSALSDEQVTFWRRTIRDMSHDGGDGQESHPYQVLLNLIARKPGIPKPKCALALEAKNNTPEELDRITALAELPDEKIYKGLRSSRTGVALTQSNWANAVKVLPKLAEQLHDVVRTGTRGNYRYFIADAPGRADVGRAPRPRRSGAIPRAPRSSREVTADTIGTAGTAEDFDEVRISPDPDPAAMAAGIATRRNRLRRHNLLVKKLARRLAAAHGQLYENPFDVLAVIDRVGILSEIKTLDGTGPDERNRVSEALAQLLYYQAFLIPRAAGDATIRMVACFEKKITNDHIQWLNRQNIAVIWDDGEVFGGDALATNFLGRYLEDLR